MPFTPIKHQQDVTREPLIPISCTSYVRRVAYASTSLMSPQDNPLKGRELRGIGEIAR